MKDDKLYGQLNISNIGVEIAVIDFSLFRDNTGKEVELIMNVGTGTEFTLVKGIYAIVKEAIESNKPMLFKNIKLKYDTNKYLIMPTFSFITHKLGSNDNNTIEIFLNKNKLKIEKNTDGDKVFYIIPNSNEEEE